MGRTVATFHQLLEETQMRWGKYRRALRREDQQVFDELFARVRTYVASGSFQTPWNPLDAIFLTLLLDQQKQIHQLSERWAAPASRPQGESPDGDRRLAPGSVPAPAGHGPVGGGSEPD